MFDVIPQNLEEELSRYVKETYLPSRFQRSADNAFNVKDLHFFGPSIEALSYAFTSERGELSKNYLNKKEFRSSYLLYFFLTNYVKVIHTLTQLDHLQKLPVTENVDILDVGAGPATASIACAHYYTEHYPKCRLTIHAVEQNKEVIKDAKHLFSRLCSEKHNIVFHSEEMRTRGISRSLPANKKFDLIIAANILNEMGNVVEEHSQFCKQLISSHLRGSFIIIDPALQKTTRNLMELRDLLLEHHDATVLAPCLHQKNCPMREANKRDWCHFYIEWKCPALIRDIDRFIGNKHDYLKMAYIIFQQDQGRGERRSPLSGHAPHAPTHRIVSSPMPSRGKAELLLCGEQGKLTRVTQLDRDRSKKAVAFHNAKRGDTVIWPENKFRVEDEKTFEVKLQWNRLQQH